MLLCFFLQWSSTCAVKKAWIVHTHLHTEEMSTSCCVGSGVWVSDLEEAETTFALFQIHLLCIKVAQRPAERRRLLEGLQLRHLAACLQCSDGCAAAVTGVFVVPVVIHCVLWSNTVTKRHDRLSWLHLTLWVIHWGPERSLRSRRKSNISTMMKN